MDQATQTADSTSQLTVDQAAARLVGMLSDDSEDRTPSDATPNSPEPAPREEPEEDEESEEPQDEPSEGDDDEVEGQEDDQDEPPQPRTFRVKVDDAEVEVTEDELIKGYSRTADYTRKTQQLAEQRKAAEVELQAVRAEREQYATHLATLEAAIRPAEPDWNTLRAELSPEDFSAAWADFQIQKEQHEKVTAEQQRVAEQQQRDYFAQLRERLDAEKGKLLEVIPAWQDAAVAKAEKAQMLQYAKTLGFSEQEVEGVMDHRAVVMLRKAMLYDAAEKAKPVVRQKIEKVRAAAPGSAASQRPPVSDLTRQKQRLAKTGRVEDAAKAIEFLDL
jgi:hypothetical protein